MQRIRNLLVVGSLLLAGTMGPVLAQSAAEVIERARAEARQFNEYKEALEDPDQSVRLAVFEAMLAQQNAPLRMMAIQTGITSTDAIMRSRALQAQIMGMEQLHLKLAINPEASTKVQEATRNFLERTAGVATFRIQNKDQSTGVFQGGGYTAQISNLQVQFTIYNATDRINMSLQDDGSLKGLYTSKDVNAVATLQLF